MIDVKFALGINNVMFLLWFQIPPSCMPVDVFTGLGKVLCIQCLTHIGIGQQHKMILLDQPFTVCFTDTIL